MYKPSMNEITPLVDQEDPLADALNDTPTMEDKIDGLFVGTGNKKITVKDIKKKIAELSKQIDYSDISKPDCENKYAHTRSICTAYIVFVLVSLIGLIGIFIWKFCRGWIKNNEEKEKGSDTAEP